MAVISSSFINPSFTPALLGTIAPNLTSGLMNVKTRSRAPVSDLMLYL
jgi:hypothetical protein